MRSDTLLGMEQDNRKNHVHLLIENYVLLLADLSEQLLL
jgi:hypothetical protein